jgi:phosphate-selective porin
MKLLTWPALAAAVLLLAGRAGAEQTLEERVKALEEKNAAKAAEGGAPEAGGTTGNKSKVEAVFDRGFRLRSEDGNFEGRIGGYVIVHGSFFIKENERNAVDTWSIREAGVEIYARLYKAFEVYVSPRVMPGGTDLYYGWVEFNKWDCLKIRAGVFKEPYSMEVAEHTKWQDFPENSFVARHDPLRDLGVMVHGSCVSGILNYAVGVFNGNGAGSNADENSDKDVVAKLVVCPGASSEDGFMKYLSQLFIGGAITHGRSRRQDNVAPFVFESNSFGRDFHQQTGTGESFRVDDDVTRAVGTFAWCIGPVEVKSEWSYYRAKIEFSDDVDTWNSYANYTSLGFWIFGSRPVGERPTIESKKCLFNGGIGGLHIAVRYSKIYLGDEFEEQAGFTGANHAREYAAVVNWYPNEHVRVSLMYAAIEYGHERAPASTGLIDDEDVLIFRAQVDF